MSSIDGQVIVLTGASSGIGEAGAVALAREGARMRLLARREDELRRVQRRIVEHGGEACLLYTSPEPTRPY